MRVYVGGSIAGGREFAQHLQLICEVLEGMGHVVTSRDFVVNLHPDDQKADRDDIFIVKRDLGNVTTSDAIVMEVSQPSHGVGYEHCWAERDGKPIQMLRYSTLRDRRYSPFLTGTGYSKLRFAFYDEANLRSVLEGFFQEFFGEDRESKIVRER